MELQNIATEQEMHQMMIDKGFVLKSQEEVDRIRKERSAAKEKEAQMRAQRQERARQRMEQKLKAAKDGTDTPTGMSVDEMVAQAVQKMKDDGKDVTPDIIRELKEEHSKKARMAYDINDQLDALPDEEQVPDEKARMRKWKEHAWKAAQAKKQQQEEEKESHIVGEEL